jgi:hypothetical protein
MDDILFGNIMGILDTILYQYVTWGNLVIVLCIGLPIMVGWNLWGTTDATLKITTLLRQFASKYKDK